MNCTSVLIDRCQRVPERDAFETCPASVDRFNCLATRQVNQSKPTVLSPSGELSRAPNMTFSGELSGRGTYFESDMMRSEIGVN